MMSWIPANIHTHRGGVLLAALLWLGTACALAEDDRAPADRLLALRSEARSYEHGEGVPKDTARAIQLYCEGARQGDAESQYSLGWMYANGRGVARDDGMASYFFALAAKQGHAQAKRMLPYVGDPVAKAPECMRELEDQAVFEAANPAQKKVLDLVLKLSPEYGIYPKLALAVIRAESNFNPGAVSPKNAQGLMQLIPETSARFNVAKPFDPEQNIRGGLAYLRWLLAYFKGNVALVAAAYNAGEGAVNRFKGIPPFAETQDYVRRIKEVFKKDEHPYDPSVTGPSPELPRIRVNKVM